MKYILTILIAFLGFNVFAQSYEQGEELVGDVGVDSSITFTVVNTDTTGLAKTLITNSEDSCYILVDSTQSTIYTSNNLFINSENIMVLLPTYADDAAAGSGGLITGQLYKTATGEVRIKL